MRRANLIKVNGELGFRMRSVKGDAYTATYLIGPNKMTIGERVIPRHTKFESISKFEGWVMRYIAEHDI